MDWVKEGDVLILIPNSIERRGYEEVGGKTWLLHRGGAGCLWLPYGSGRARLCQTRLLCWAVGSRKESELSFDSSLAGVVHIPGGHEWAARSTEER